MDGIDSLNSSLYSEYRREYPLHPTATMTELSFAKSFLATLDSRSTKLQADHVADPKTFEPKGAVSSTLCYRRPNTQLTHYGSSIPCPAPPSQCADVIPLLNHPPRTEP